MLLGTVEIDSGLPVMKYEKVGADLGTDLIRCKPCYVSSKCLEIACRAQKRGFRIFIRFSHSGGLSQNEYLTTFGLDVAKCPKPMKSVVKESRLRPKWEFMVNVTFG